MSSSTTAEVDARLGQVLKGKWTLERVLGIGGMAAVYVAQHKIGRREAIKIMHADVARDEEQRRRFEQEARAANTLTHPGIVEVRDVDVTEDGCPFMVMELLEGDTLADLANKNGGLPVQDLLRYADEALDVLAVAHERGIVHRDIKLGNLFVTCEGALKVLDFGIARVGSSQMTRLGARLGTAAYMPPEQIKGEAIDGRADIFAVGATMFRILAKRRIHEVQGEVQLLAKMATEPAPLLATVCDAPPDVCLIVDRALAYRADDRYPDARRMQADVKAVRQGEKPPYASSASAGTSPMRVSATNATRADVPSGRVVGASALTAVTSGHVVSAQGPVAPKSGPSSTTLQTGTAPTVMRGGAGAAYEATGYDATPQSVRVHVGGVTARDARDLGSAATIMPVIQDDAPFSQQPFSQQPTAVPSGRVPGAAAMSVRQPTPAPGSLMAVGAGGQIVVSPHSSRGEVVPSAGATMAAFGSAEGGSWGAAQHAGAPRSPQPHGGDDASGTGWRGLPQLPTPAARFGAGPMALAAIGGGVLFVVALLVIFVIAFSDDETAAPAAAGAPEGAVPVQGAIDGPAIAPSPPGTPAGRAPVVVPPRPQRGSTVPGKPASTAQPTSRAPAPPEHAPLPSQVDLGNRTTR